MSALHWIGLWSRAHMSTISIIILQSLHVIRQFSYAKRVRKTARLDKCGLCFTGEFFQRKTLRLEIGTWICALQFGFDFLLNCRYVITIFLCKTVSKNKSLTIEKYSRYFCEQSQNRIYPGQQAINAGFFANWYVPFQLFNSIVSLLHLIQNITSFKHKQQKPMVYEKHV